MRVGSRPSGPTDRPQPDSGRLSTLVIPPPAKDGRKGRTDVRRGQGPREVPMSGQVDRES